jgi:hypothetical protein
MYDQKFHYCFTLSKEQMKYLRSKKYKIDRMECFMSLVELAERETKLVQISKTQQVEILPGQVMVDNTQLAKLWNKDRKTVPKLIEAMEALGISSSQKVGDNRIHTLHAFSGWYVDGMFVKNPFATRRNADGTLQSSPRKFHLPRSSLSRCQMTETKVRKILTLIATIPKEETWV